VWEIELAAKMFYNSECEDRLAKPKRGTSRLIILGRVKICSHFVTSSI
jgi:hypothetical protein